MNISEEAVEAAARAAAKDEDASNWDDEPDYYKNGWMNRILPALEAASPYLMAQAWEEGKFIGQTGGWNKPNPYRHAGAGS